MAVRFAQTTVYGVIVSATLILSNGPVRAEPDDPIREIVVIGSRTETPRVELGSSISVLDESQIAVRQVQSAADLLRDVPGLSVNRSGVFGALTEVRVRGAESTQTLVFIDGAEAFDPAQENFAFNSLATFDIERIEVLRGSQSALYGSSAVGGVINIVTKSGAEGLQVEAETEAGSFGTYQFGGAVGGGSKALTARMSLYYLSTEGENTALVGSETESFENLTVNGRFRFSPNDAFELQGSARFFDAEAGFDDALGFLQPAPSRSGLVVDAENLDVQKEFSGQLKAGLSLFDGAWRHSASAAYYESENDSINGPDSFFCNPFSDNVFTADAQRLKFLYQSTGRLETGFADHTITAAVEREEKTFTNDAGDSFDNDQTSFVGEYKIGLMDRLFLSAGVRHDANQLFEDATTYRTALSALFPETGTRFHSSFGTGIQDPTFFDLFGFTGNFQGDPNLAPQDSQSFDAGIEQSLLDGDLVFDVTYFKAKLTDEIVTTFNGSTFVSANEDGQSDREGVEFFFNYSPSDRFSLTGSYTLTETEDPDGRQEIRRPRHSASANATLRFWDLRGAVDVGLDYSGTQSDTAFFGLGSAPVELDSFLLVNVASKVQITDTVELFARVENLTNADHEEVFGFNSSGVAGFGGLRLSFAAE